MFQEDLGYYTRANTRRRCLHLRRSPALARETSVFKQMSKLSKRVFTRKALGRRCPWPGSPWSWGVQSDTGCQADDSLSGIKSRSNLFRSLILSFLSAVWCPIKDSLTTESTDHILEWFPTYVCRMMFGSFLEWIMQFAKFFHHWVGQ